MKRAAPMALAMAVLGILSFGIAWHVGQNAPAGDAEPTPAEQAASLQGEPAEEIDWDYWTGVNPDVVAWVRVAGTAIDYPVVKASEDAPDFYLHHDIEGNESERGCPYVDSECVDGIDAPNAVFLAHNMADGSMFSDFARYVDQGFAEEHRTIELFFPGGKRELEVTSAWTIPGSEAVKKCDFVNEKSFVEYKGQCYDESGMKLATREEATAPSRLYTFCTCSYYENPEDERTLVFARKAHGEG